MAFKDSKLSLEYIQNSYEESRQFLQEWKNRKVRQLVLLNNLQRGDQNIASTLLLTLFNRDLSSLYDDKIQIKFTPTQGITQNQINSYNILSQSDYLEMGKAKLDHDWTWDALFFGRGYMETMLFNKRKKIMEPHVINPLAFGYDPYVTEIQEWRYYWKWITKSKYEIQRLIKNGTITGIKKPEEIPAGFDELFWEYKTKRDDAKKAVQPPIEPSRSDIYQILEFYGYNDEGEKCAYWMDRDMTKVLWQEVLDLEDLDYGDDKEKGSKWPIVSKECFREPHASINFGVPDILEDKHRAKSVLLNLAYIAAKDQANPTYLYVPEKVKDLTQFFSRQINQHIPVEDVVTAVAPLNKDKTMSPEMISFISMLQQEANAPIGTGVVLQPQRNKTSNTATEAAIDQQLNDMAQSLQSKVLQFGESEFWSHWFHRYAKHGEALGEKMANIVGVKGIDSKIIDLKDFNTDYPPGVLVFSAKEAEYKNLVKRRDMMQMLPIQAQTMDADGFRSYQKHVFWPLFLEDPSLIDIMYPKTIDEIKAEAENEQLARNELVEALSTDNHTTHIYTHMMLQPKTWAVWFHLKMHEDMLAEQKAMEMQAMAMQMQAQPLDKAGQGMQKMNMGVEKRSPIAAASPLKTEFNPQTSAKAPSY